MSAALIRLGGTALLLIFMLLFSVTIAVLGAILSKLFDWMIK
jgi:hypothetical protein